MKNPVWSLFWLFNFWKISKFWVLSSKSELQIRSESCFLVSMTHNVRPSAEEKKWLLWTSLSCFLADFHQFLLYDKVKQIFEKPRKLSSISSMCKRFYPLQNIRTRTDFGGGHSASYSVDTGDSSLGGKRGWGVLPTTHLLLVQRLNISAFTGTIELLCPRVLLRLSNTKMVSYLPTPRSRVIFKKLIGSQLVKKFLAFYGTRRFIMEFTSACHPSLFWARSIHSMPLIPLPENPY